MNATRKSFFDDIRELETVADFVRYGASCLEVADCHYGHGMETALDESHALVLHAIQLWKQHVGPHPLPTEVYGARLVTSEKQAVGELFWRRIEGRMPAAYLIGESTFAGLTFSVDKRVLVPRSPLAEVIEIASKVLLSSAPREILEIGTGSGCIAVACAAAWPEAHITATDIDSGAREVAISNVRRYGLSDRIEVKAIDVFSGLEGTFDLIISNPPYVSLETIDSLPEEYLHEPRIGLEAGVDGLDIVRRILEGGRQYLACDGAMIVEVGEARSAMEDAYPRLPIYWLDDELERGGEGVLFIRAADLP